MDQIYSNKMAELGYNQLVCDIFIDWESVKDEILIPERKVGSGNGTIHVFLGAADSKLKQEFASYYENVNTGANPESDAVEVCHYFMVSNVISMLGYVCKYHYDNHEEIVTDINSILSVLSSTTNEKGLLKTKSLFKLSLGSNKLRPYFKQFDSDGVFVKLIRRILLPNSSYKISLYKNNVGEYAAFWLIGFDWQSDFEANSNNWYTKSNKILYNSPLQRIYFGAPGTGKSFKINEEVLKGVDNSRIFRTTFHPDTDYASFVGCYKPKMEGKEISYEFVPQVFTDAYIKAWSSDEPVYLVIEEINRGNCVQIFGDLFQLLDRKNGVSEYSIKADKDLCKYLTNELGTDNEGIADGNLKLPANFNILATMNTSDQSLFPMDSAFKRRWEWEYVPINPDHEKAQFQIKIGDKEYLWSGFLKEINTRIKKSTDSEDKQMGEFFIKHNVDEKEFKSKVMFYLWCEICKDNPKAKKDMFMYMKMNGASGKEDKTEFTFDELFGSDSVTILQGFMSFLGIKEI